MFKVKPFVTIHKSQSLLLIQEAGSRFSKKSNHSQDGCRQYHGQLKSSLSTAIVDLKMLSGKMSMNSDGGCREQLIGIQQFKTRLGPVYRIKSFCYFLSLADFMLAYISKKLGMKKICLF